MKKLLALGFLALFLFPPVFVQAQTWVTRKISNTSGYSYRPKIAVSGSNVYIAWGDNTLGSSEIFFKSSINGGATWSLQKNLTNDVGNSAMGDMVYSEPYLYLVWPEDTLNESKIYFKRSKDGGATWSNTKRISSMPGWSHVPTIAANDKRVYVAWSYGTKANARNEDIYFITSNDAGQSWTSAKQLSNPSGDSAATDLNLLASGSNLFLLWHEYSPGYNQDYFVRSSDGGESWKAYKKLSSGAKGAQWPRIAMNDPFLYVVWSEVVDPPLSVRVNFKKSANNGVSWSAAYPFDSTGGQADISALGSNLYLVWINKGLILTRSNDQGESWKNPKRLSLTNTQTGWPRIVTDENGKIYIVYAEASRSDGQGNWDIYLKYSKD